MLSDDAKLRGTLHVFVAFDWGDEINLEHARRLLPAEKQELVRRRRTPSSIAYRPSPLRYPLGNVQLELAEIGPVEVLAEAVVFDFGGVSISLQAPFKLPPTAIVRLASSLAEPRELVEAARNASKDLFLALCPAIQQPKWSPLSEEYFVFQIPPAEPLPAPAALLDQHADWLAALVRLEAAPLSNEERSAALQSRISYSVDDMLLAEWSASLLVDRDCEETLQTIEFANLQLLEYRFIDDLLDARLSEAYSIIHRTLRSWLPFWRTHSRPLRRLGELRIEANNLFERTGNALKLLGDQYLARVHRLIAGRFRLSDWEQSIRASLDVVEGAYQVVSDQAASFRIEFLELVVIVLITIEIVLALWRH